MELIPIIDDLHNELKSRLPLSETQSNLLEKKIRLEFNYNSNHIEGNTLTYAETELLLIAGEIVGNVNHTLREFEEMKASDVTYQMIKGLANMPDSQLTEQFIKELNQILLVEPYWKEAITSDKQKTKRKISIGEYKKEPNSVILENGEIFQYATPIETPALMGDLIVWLRQVEEQKQMHPVEIAADLHYKFVRIHPFDDGNGRIARLLMNYVFIKNSFPPVVVKSSDKKIYLRALRQADAGQSEVFRTYIGQQALWSLELGLKAANNQSLEEDEDWKKQLMLIKRNLSSRDTIKTTKSVEAVQNIIRNVIYPAYKKVIANLTEFDELFLKKSLLILNQNSGSSINFDGQEVRPNVIEAHFFHNWHLILKFEEFTKDPDNPFTIQIFLDVNMTKHKYEIFSDKQLVFKKLYHQTFTEKDIYDFTNLVGKVLTSAIEQKINTAK